jgi:Fe-S-cluster containining protein
MILCICCAQRGTACCLHRDILITGGDLQRITSFTGRADFSEYRVASSPAYLDQDDDPNWNFYTLQLGNTRQVLKHAPGNLCVFLSENGCSLPATVRPLICRLHPVEYNEAAITGLSTDCPVELLPPSEKLLDNLRMDINEAEQLRKQLYEELRFDFNTRLRPAV